MKSSHLEKRFALTWRACNGPALVAEHRFHAARKWRFDFAHVESRTAFEIQGGAWVQGRHSRGAGMSKDCDKSIAAALEGWVVVPLTREQITVPTVERLIRLCNERLCLFSIHSSPRTP